MSYLRELNNNKVCVVGSHTDSLQIHIMNCFQYFNTGKRFTSVNEDDLDDYQIFLSLILRLKEEIFFPFDILDDTFLKSLNVKDNDNIFIYNIEYLYFIEEIEEYCRLNVDAFLRHNFLKLLQVHFSLVCFGREADILSFADCKRNFLKIHNSPKKR